MGKRGRYLGTAIEARRVADDLLTSKPDIKHPPGTNRALTFFTKEYAAVVRLMALRKMERALQGTTNVPDVIAILKASMEHEDWAIEKMKVKKGRFKPKPKPGEGEKSEESTGDPASKDVPEKVMEPPAPQLPSKIDLDKIDNLKKPVSA